MAENDPLLKPKEAARRLSVNIETVRRWMRKGVLRVVLVGPYQRQRVRQSDVEACIVERRSA